MINSIIAIVACVIMSAYFSATETAFLSMNKTRLKALAENGNRKAALALRLSDDYDRLISTILIGNNIVNIAVASIATVLFIQICGEKSGPSVSTAVVTIVVLIFGEITPKSLAKDYPETFAMFSSPILRVIIWVFTPLNFLFAGWKKLVSKLVRSTEDSKMSQEELLLLLDEVQQEGGIDEDEGVLLKNAVEFGDLEAQDILTHRVDLEGVSIDATKEEVARMFDRSRFSRLPVYEGTVDNIVGIIHQKDFYTGGGMTDQPLKDIITPPLFVHQTEKIDNLLQTLRAAKSHIAIVVDEYGGTMGIVTMEDILEELVGEIWDEHDEVEEPIRMLEQGEYLVDGGVSLSDFCNQFDVDSDSESVSVGGWVMDQLECIPDKGQNFIYENLDITVCAVEDHRVESVRVRVLEPAEEE